MTAPQCRTETPLSPQAYDTYATLVTVCGPEDGSGWRTVHLDDARPNDMPLRTFHVILGELRSAGYFKPLGLGPYYGRVRVEHAELASSLARYTL